MLGSQTSLLGEENNNSPCYHRILFSSQWDPMIFPAFVSGVGRLIYHVLHPEWGEEMNQNLKNTRWGVSYILGLTTILQNNFGSKYSETGS